MVNMHHVDGPACELCDFKLLTSHPFLQGWFHRVKAKYVNVHISWAYRGQEDQERAFLNHQSNDHFPNSPHNHTENGQPCSLALDIFQIDEDGVARFNPLFCTKLDHENQANQEPILNGGSFKRKDGKPLGDYNHFQYTGPI